MMAEMTTRTMYRRNQMLCLRRLTLRRVGCTLRPPEGRVLPRLGYSEWPERLEWLGEPDARRWDRVSVCARVIPPVCGSCFTSISDSPGFGKGNGGFFRKN